MNGLKTSRLHHGCERPDCSYSFFNVSALGEPYHRLPVCKKILLECAVRKAQTAKDNAESKVWTRTAGSILEGRPEDGGGGGILFHPGRIVLQDFTSVAALVDLAAIRDEVQDPLSIDSFCPVDLVVDNFVQVDFSHIKSRTKAKEEDDLNERLQRQVSVSELNSVHHSTFPPPMQFPPYFYPVYPLPQQQQGFYQGQTVPNETNKAKAEVPCDNPGLPVQDAVCPFHQHMSYWAEELNKNRKAEMEKNAERFGFLKWVDSAFDNITVVPPGTGMLHQLNLEYLARVVTCQNEMLFPDSVVGTDAHTTMVNGVGVLGWTVGTLETEAVMFGHPLSLPNVPNVVGVRLVGSLGKYATSTDLVMLITKKLRRQCSSVDGSDVFVEFFGPSVEQLSIADRSAISNLCSEYGAQAAYFPVDKMTMKYLAQTGRSQHELSVIETYLKRVDMFRLDDGDRGQNLRYDDVIDVDLSEVLVSVSGPKRVKDRVLVENVASGFRESLVTNFNVDPNLTATAIHVDLDRKLHTVVHGSVLMASIASCTNTSNPTVMLTAGLLAKKAVEAGLSVPKYIKTSLTPGSGIVTSYLRESGVMPYLYMLGFEVVGYGCAKCVDNTATNVPCLVEAVRNNGVICCGVLAGNRNYEGRCEPELRANYLTSAPLVIAFALAGRIDINFEKEPLGCDRNGPAIYLRDIWPCKADIQDVEMSLVIPALFNQLRQNLTFGNEEWSEIEVASRYRFAWDSKSTFIRPPRYIKDVIDVKKLTSLSNLRCLIKMGDDVTSDYISPAGSIVRSSPAADYLSSHGLAPRQFNSYGSRRGNWEVMAAGTFSHLKLRNLMAHKPGPFTVHHPSNIPTTIVDASNKYRETPDVNGIVVVAGENYGRGAPRDWATKGPLSLGVRVVMAVSFDQRYRANLFKTGILPLEITRKDWEQLRGDELFHVHLDDDETKEIQPKGPVSVSCSKKDSTKRMDAVLGLYNEYEIKVFRNGGVIRDAFLKLNEKRDDLRPLRND